MKQIGAYDGGDWHNQAMRDYCNNINFGAEYFAHPSELDTQPSVQIDDVSAINVAPIESSIAYD
jgi:hypothetical protein